MCMLGIQASGRTCIASAASSAAAATTLPRSSCICPSSGSSASRPGCCWCCLNPEPWLAEGARPSSSGVSCSSSAATGPHRWQKAAVLGQAGHCSAALQQARPACVAQPGAGKADNWRKMGCEQLPESTAVCNNHEGPGGGSCCIVAIADCCCKASRGHHHALN